MCTDWQNRQFTFDSRQVQPTCSKRQWLPRCSTCKSHYMAADADEPCSSLQQGTAARQWLVQTLHLLQLTRFTASCGMLDVRTEVQAAAAERRSSCSSA